LLRDLENLFDEIPDLAEAALRSLEQRIIEIAEFEDEILIGHSLGIRVDSGSPLPALVSEESVKKIVLVLTHAGEFVGSLSLDRDQAALPPEALTDRLLESLAWPLVRGYLGLVPPDDILLEAPPISADSSRLFIWLCRSMIPILRWQRSAGILRNRAVFKGSFRLISELAPLRLARELYRCEPRERSGLLRAALDRAALRALGARLPVVEFR